VPPPPRNRHRFRISPRASQHAIAQEMVQKKEGAQSRPIMLPPLPRDGMGDRAIQSCTHCQMVNSLGRASRFLFPIRFPRGGAEGERAGAREREGCRRRIQSCVGTDANLPFWAPCLSGLPILLQHRVQLARHRVQLLSKGREMRAAGGWCAGASTEPRFR